MGSSNRRTYARIGWLVGPVALLAAVAAIVLLRRGPSGILGAVLIGLLALAMGWIFLSIFWPARAERTCPRCAHDALVRLDARTTIGIRCRACGFEDASASSWLLAEEDGALESIVLEQRGRGRRTRTMDSAKSAD